MKPLRVVFKVAVATCFFFFLTTSFKPEKKHPSVQRDTYYYWYLDGGTVYDDWTSVAIETTRLETSCGCYVDEDPDGTLIAEGFAVSGYPHRVYASVLLYAH